MEDVRRWWEQCCELNKVWNRRLGMENRLDWQRTLLFDQLHQHVHQEWKTSPISPKEILNGNSVDWGERRWDQKDRLQVKQTKPCKGTLPVRIAFGFESRGWRSSTLEARVILAKEPASSPIWSSPLWRSLGLLFEREAEAEDEGGGVEDFPPAGRDSKSSSTDRRGLIRGLGRSPNWLRSSTDWAFFEEPC